MPRLSRILAVFIPVWLASASAPGTDLLPLEGPWRCGSDPAKPETCQPAKLPYAHRGDAALRFRLDAPVPAPWAGFDARLRVMATGFIEAMVNGHRLGRADKTRFERDAGRPYLVHQRGRRALGGRRRRRRRVRGPTGPSR